MATLIAFSKWLETTNVSWAVRGGMPWIWPAAETLHFIGLCMLVGAIGVMDLRLMGWLKGIPIGPLERLVPWAVAGFVINVITGVLFYIGAPGQYYGNSMFWAYSYSMRPGISMYESFSLGVAFSLRMNFVPLYLMRGSQ